MRHGIAKLTATTQHFLDTCPAVKSWTLSADEKTATFIFDPAVDVPLVPAGVDFDFESSEEFQAGVDAGDYDSPTAAKDAQELQESWAGTLGYCPKCGRWPAEHIGGVFCDKGGRLSPRTV